MLNDHGPNEKGFPSKGLSMPLIYLDKLCNQGFLGGASERNPLAEDAISNHSGGSQVGFRHAPSGIKLSRLLSPNRSLMFPLLVAIIVSELALNMRYRYMIWVTECASSTLAFRY